jgi:EAL domain-containing protein (putative c-di-GMP-specific phosphodiesterase class I)
VTGSIGITLYPDDATDIESLYKNADQAMYVSKEAGRNQFSFFTQHMQSQAKLRQEAISELRHAVEQEQFEVYFQPVVDVKQKTLFGAEALLRWQHPEKGTILPDDFIELAEETGLINVIGKWVIDETLRYVKRWQDLGFDLSVSVNKSPKQFHSEECKFDISNKLTDMGIQPHRFAIEITEQVLIEHKDWISPVLTCYRDAGVQIILDDFGHGYTALSHLSAFPIDIVKIDKHFVDSLESEPQPLKAMTAMIHHLGKTVAIEGIESTEQMTWLTQEQGQLFQGHLYSEALPAEQFEQRFCRDREWEAYV